MRWYYKVGIVFAFLLSIICFLVFGLKIKHVKVEGTKIYSDREIEDSVFSRKHSKNELVFAIQRKLYGINKLPFVQDIEVTYNNRNTVTLFVYDKTISGCIKYLGQYVYFDKDGTVLQSMKVRRDGVLMVTGIRLRDFTVGRSFRVDDDTLFQTIMNLSQLVSHYDIEANRIHIGDNEITLYAGDIKVLLGKKTMYDDELSALSSALKTAKEKNLSGTIDMKSFEKGDKFTLKTEDSSGKTEK